MNRELEDRGIDLPKFATKAWKMKMLDDLTHEEETKELLSIAEAVRCRITCHSLGPKDVWHSYNEASFSSKTGIIDCEATGRTTDRILSLYRPG